MQTVRPVLRNTMLCHPTYLRPFMTNHRKACFPLSTSFARSFTPSLSTPFSLISPKPFALQSNLPFCHSLASPTPLHTHSYFHSFASSSASSISTPLRHYSSNGNEGGSGSGGGNTPNTNSISHNHNRAPKAFSHESIGPGAVAAPMSTATMLPPDAVIVNISAKGVYMARLSTFRMLVGGWLAGIFLSFGCSLMVQVAGIPFIVPGLHTLLGAFVFPVGLTLITWHGADLLTGCFMYCYMPLLSEMIPRDEAIRGLVRCWLVVGFANLVACMMMALFIAPLTSPLCAQFIGGLAVKKTSLTFGTCFAKAIGANFLVCTAMAGAMSAQNPGGKLLCIWLPIFTFVAMGLEHSIANMFLIPLGMHFSNVTIYDFIVGNQIPAILGNICGAWLFGTAMWFRHRRR